MLWEQTQARLELQEDGLNRRVRDGLPQFGGRAAPLMSNQREALKVHVLRSRVIALFFAVGARSMRDVLEAQKHFCGAQCLKFRDDIMANERFGITPRYGGIEDFGGGDVV